MQASYSLVPRSDSLAYITHKAKSHSHSWKEWAQDEGHGYSKHQASSLIQHQPGSPQTSLPGFMIAFHSKQARAISISSLPFWLICLGQGIYFFLAHLRAERHTFFSSAGLEALLLFLLNGSHRGVIIVYHLCCIPVQRLPSMAGKNCCPCRGFVAAGLGKPALAIERKHPWLVRTAVTAFNPLLKNSYIMGRTDEVSFAATASWRI